MKSTFKVLFYLKNDKIYVTAGPLNGNAVIAGYNSSGHGPQHG